MTALDALQGCLAAEHAAVYGYGLLGGVIAGVASGSADDARAYAAYGAHRGRRDSLSELIAGLGSDPVAAEVAYDVAAVTTLADCRELAQDLEMRTAEVYAFALSETVDETRELALAALKDCAVREVSWGARPQPFPGLPL